MRVVALVLLAGCKQVYGLAEPQLHGDASTQIADTLAADATIPLTCDPDEANLIACFDFENDVVDLSSSKLSATPTNVSFEAGKLELAVRVGATSTIDIELSESLAVDAVAIEAWIRPDQLPGPMGRFGIWDTDGSYGAFVMGDGSILCNPQSGARTAGGLIAAGIWTHVVCTFDATTLHVYINGVEVLETEGGTIGPNTINGTSLGGNAPSGDRFLGLIDSLRVYGAVRTRAEICQTLGC